MTDPAAPTCRCGARLKPADDKWQALDGERPGDFWCPGGSLHEPVRERRAARFIAASLMQFAGAFCAGFAISLAMHGWPGWLIAILAAAAAVLVTPYVVMLVRAGRGGAR